MVEVVCPKCGLKAEFAQGITVDDPMKCEDLRGTRYEYAPGSVFPTGPESWCPTLSDAAPADRMFLPPGYRPQVLAAIEEARAQRPK